MPELERLERDVFTRKLVRICERLDEASEREFTDKFMGKRKTKRGRITTLWVVGSYARGASHCGDLDLVFQYEHLSACGLPYSHTIARAFFGSLPYVRPYLGTPDENRSGIAFPDAICIWHGPGCDWRSAIAVIQVNPAAGRAPRASDAIPFVSEQLAGAVGKWEEWVVLRDQGVLAWEFLPFDLSRPVPADHPCLKRKRGAPGWYMKDVGKKSQQILTLLGEPMQTIEPFGRWFSPNLAIKNELQCGATLVVMGFPGVPLARMENNLSVRQLLIVPHITKRGPNGAWLIKRGPNHPDTIKMVGKQIYYLVCEGTPRVLTNVDMDRHSATSIELFTCQADAQDRADSLNEGDPDWTVACAHDAAILDLCGLADVVDFDGNLLPTHHGGRTYAERDDDANIAELAALLENV